MSGITDALTALRAEARQLETRLATVRQAITALSGAELRPARTSAAKKARRTRPPMTAAQKKAVSARMKKYWAKRRKAAKR